MSKLTRFSLAWLFLSLILLAIGLVSAFSSITSQVESLLVETLPAKVSQSLKNRISGDALDTALIRTIDNDLSTLVIGTDSSRSLSLTSFQSCIAYVQQYKGYVTGNSEMGLHRLIDIFIPDEAEAITVSLSCQLSPVYMLSQVTLAFIFVCLITALPLPSRNSRFIWFEKLQESGTESEQAWQASGRIDRLNDSQRFIFDKLQTNTTLPLPEILELTFDDRMTELKPEQLPWFELGLKHSSNDIEKAFSIACSEAHMFFDVSTHSVIIHGVQIKLPSTPFFYYYWYASLLNHHTGWYINPAINRPDLEQGQRLAEIISAGSGHGKAINDLKNKGLRAKTLDQNRNKIKEEITRVLGSELAELYLFVCERDPKTMRFKYRLQINPDKITFSETI
ncbi:hypothetical protein [Endozoicomonas arenosclerae]|uniref:hypothetical protein n=1 Tax=Endozoicomonas arenosclerae TaxID=1633495 RepID=UPI000780C66A|nr:hypothetical protein [Endozoicomonas arenosclerae]